jgi:hypothetical protein
VEPEQQRTFRSKCPGIVILGDSEGVAPMAKSHTGPPVPHIDSQDAKSDTMDFRFPNYYILAT